MKRQISAILLCSALFSGPVAAELGEPSSVPEVVQKLTELYGQDGPILLPLAQQEDPLGHLLSLQKLHWAPAWVTSTFYDWRTVSKYRRKAGLHLGYDIALPLNTPVSVGWAGVVVSVLPWTATEYGVTVRSPDGTEVTYGHISPAVSVGQQLGVGAIVGHIASDHVDVKMRDSSGRYIPFGEGERNPGIATPRLSREGLLTAWLVAKSSSQQAEEDLFYARNAKKKWALEERSAQRRLKALDRTLKQLEGPKSEGLISRRRLEELKAERAAAKRSLERVALRKKSDPKELELRFERSLANLKAIEAWANSQALSWRDVEDLVEKTLGQKAAEATSSSSVEQLKERVEKGQEQLDKLEALYAAGGLSEKEIEDRRLRQQLLVEEYQLRVRRKYP